MRQLMITGLKISLAALVLLISPATVLAEEPPEIKIQTRDADRLFKQVGIRSPTEINGVTRNTRADAFRLMTSDGFLVSSFDHRFFAPDEEKDRPEFQINVNYDENSNYQSISLVPRRTGGFLTVGIADRAMVSHDEPGEAEQFDIIYKKSEFGVDTYAFRSKTGYFLSSQPLNRLTRKKLSSLDQISEHELFVLNPPTWVQHLIHEDSGYFVHFTENHHREQVPKLSDTNAGQLRVILGPNGFYIFDVNTGLFLTSDGATVSAAPKTGVGLQLWRFEDDGWIKHPASGNFLARIGFDLTMVDAKHGKHAWTGEDASSKARRAGIRPDFQSRLELIDLTCHKFIGDDADEIWIRVQIDGKRDRHLRLSLTDCGRTELQTVYKFKDSIALSMYASRDDGNLYMGSLNYFREDKGSVQDISMSFSGGSYFLKVRKSGGNPDRKRMSHMSDDGTEREMELYNHPSIFSQMNGSYWCDKDPRVARAAPYPEPSTNACSTESFDWLIGNSNFDVFNMACVSHDLCYSAPWFDESGRARCDEALIRDLFAICYRAADGDEDKLDDCISLYDPVADIFDEATPLGAFAASRIESSWKGGQDWAKKHCERY